MLRVAVCCSVRVAAKPVHGHQRCFSAASFSRTAKSRLKGPSSPGASPRIGRRALGASLSAAGDACEPLLCISLLSASPMASSSERTAPSPRFSSTCVREIGACIDGAVKQPCLSISASISFRSASLHAPRSELSPLLRPSATCCARWARGLNGPGAGSAAAGAGACGGAAARCGSAAAGAGSSTGLAFSADLSGVASPARDGTSAGVA
mmetsp:Transcript_84774/g.182827  ORF Transcript_84774/g.182827 Transcript_84774/m.182827 type:complete len:209 (-) Transcript_84774:961-1587(-)